MFFVQGRGCGWDLIWIGRIRRNAFRLEEEVASEGLAGEGEGEGRGGRVSSASSREKGGRVVATATALKEERAEGTKGVFRPLR